MHGYPSVCPRLFLCLFLGLWACPGFLGAQSTVYWDLNGTEAGAGSNTPAGLWNSSSLFWNPASDGTGAVAAWTAGNIAAFAAGADATGTYSITVEGTQDIRGLTFEEGAVTLQGGALNFTGPTVFNIAPAVTARLTDMVLSGAASLKVSGKGTLVMNGTAANTFDGGFHLDGGTVELDSSGGQALGVGDVRIESIVGATGNINPSTVRLLADNQIHDTSHVTVISRQFRAGLLDLNGHEETIGGLTIAGYTGTVGVGVVTGAGGVLTVTGDINLHNDRGSASGNNIRDVLITGTGDRNSVAADSGILDLGGAMRTVTVQSRAANQYGFDDASIDTTIRNGGLIKAGAQILYLLGTNIYEGGTTITEGTLSIGAGPNANLNAGSATGSIIGNVLNNATLDFNRSNAYTFAGDISGTGAVTKRGTGILTLSGNNTYEGLTSVLVGSLSVSNLGMAGVAANTNIGTNGVLMLGNAALDVGLIYTGAGEMTDKILRFTGSTGGLTLAASGSGAVVIGEALEFVTAGDKTLTLTGTSTDENTLLGGLADPVDGGRLSLLKSGSGTWVLGGLSAHTGGTTVNGGTLRLSGAGSLPQTGVQVLDGTFDIAGTEDLTLSGDPELKLASEELVHYALLLGGGDAGSAATVSLAAGRTLNLESHVGFSSTGNNLGAAITGGTLDFGEGLKLIIVNNSSNAAPDLTIDSQVRNSTGGTLLTAGDGTLAFGGALDVAAMRVNTGRVELSGPLQVVRNSLQVGINGTGALAYDAADGELRVGSGSSDTLDVGITINEATYAYAAPSGTLDLRGLEKLTANVGMVRVGVHTSATGNVFSVPGDASLNGLATPTGMTPGNNFFYLAKNNDITATSYFAVADAASSSVGSGSTSHQVQFGEGLNLIRTPAMYIGWRKGGATATIREGGTLQLQGVATGARATLNIAYNAVNTAGNTVSLMDLGPGALVASLSELRIGWKSSGSSAAGSATGTLILGAGPNEVDVSGNVIIGHLAGSQYQTSQGAPITSYGNGTLTFGGGTMNVGGNVELGRLALTGNGLINELLSSRGTLTLTGGSFTVGGNIATTQDTLDRSSGTVSLQGGLLDMTGGNIGAANAPVTFNFESGGLRNLAEYNAGADLVKTTERIATLGGVNSYTGDTVVQAGALEVMAGSRTGAGNAWIGSAAASASMPLSPGPFLAPGGPVLAGEGTVSGITTLLSGSIRPGADAGVGRGMLTMEGDLILNASSDGAVVLGLRTPTGLADLELYEVSQIPDHYNFATYENELGNIGDHDLLRIQGGLTWNSGTTLVVEDEGAAYAYGQVFNLLDWTGLINGGPEFSTSLTQGGEVNEWLHLPSLAGTHYFWDLSLFTTHGLIVVVPEPGRITLLFGGLLLALRRRRFQASC